MISPNKLKLLAALLACAVTANSHALTITAGTTPAVIFGNDSSQNAINAIILPFTGTTLEAYKDEGNAELGVLAGSYTTAYGIVGLQPESFSITYNGGNILAGNPLYLLVKDGGATPNWYLYDITGWNGTETIFGQNFFPNQGGISHVSLYGGNRPPGPGPSVPEGGTTAVLLGLAMAGLGVGRRFLKA